MDVPILRYWPTKKTQNQGVNIFFTYSFASIQQLIKVLIIHQNFSLIVLSRKLTGRDVYHNFQGVKIDKNVIFVTPGFVFSTVFRHFGHLKMTGHVTPG